MSTSNTPETTSTPLVGHPVPALPFDVAAILIFALLARIAHNTPDMPLSFLGWLDTSWPFLIGVGLAWALWGGNVSNLRSWGMQSFGFVVWLCSLIAGLGIWTISHGDLPHWSFVLVASITSGIFLFSWRSVARILDRKRR